MAIKLNFTSKSGAHSGQVTLEAVSWAFLFFKNTKVTKSGSYVNYLYQNNHLVAELAYWKGTFIKARTYNHDGCMVHQYNDRNINIEDQTFQDWEEETKWYVD